MGFISNIVGWFVVACLGWDLRFVLNLGFGLDLRF